MKIIRCDRCGNDTSLYAPHFSVQAHGVYRAVTGYTELQFCSQKCVALYHVQVLVEKRQYREQVLDELNEVLVNATDNHIADSDDANTRELTPQQINTLTSILYQMLGADESFSAERKIVETALPKIRRCVESALS